MNEIIQTFKFNIGDLIYVVPEIFLLSAISFILIFNLFLSKQFREVSYYLSQITLLITLALSFNLLNKPDAVIFSNSFIHDDIATISKIFVYIFTMISLVYSRYYIKTHKFYSGEYFVLTLISVLGSMVILSGYNLLTIYLGLEILSLSLYTLIAMVVIRGKAIEAALKYFILGAVASGLLLYGITMIYGISGSIDISEINKFAYSSYLDNRDILILNFGLIFIIAGLAFKLGAVPFHMWVPDVYHGSPTSVTMFLSTVPKIAAVVMTIRLLTDALGSLVSYWQDILTMLAVLSIIIGTLAAVKQKNIKRMLAYSTIAHIGFVLLGFITGVVSGYAAAVFYVLAYVLMGIAGFGIIILLNTKGFDTQKISDFKGLSRTHPWFALMMLIVMLSMAGIPPFIGFYSKFFVLQQVIFQGFVWLAVLALVFTVIGAFYYLRVIKVMFFDSAKKTIRINANMDIQLVTSINSIVILLLGLYPNYWFELIISIFIK